MNRKVKAYIVLNGLSITGIAREKGVSREWLSKTVNGHAKSPRMRKIVADALKMTVEELWPNGNNKAA